MVSKHSGVEALTARTFDELLTSSPGPVVVELWARECRPCRAMLGVLTDVADRVDGVRFGEVMLDDAPELAVRFEVTALPTLLIFANGRARARLEGTIARDRLVSELGQLTARMKALMWLAGQLAWEDKLSCLRAHSVLAEPPVRDRG